MKILSLNFMTCAVKACKSTSASFPLHPRDAELAHDDLELNKPFLTTIVKRLDWPALRTTLVELGFPPLPEEPPTDEALESDDKLLGELHNVLVETEIVEGKLVCGNCGHEYGVREGIANFLLPSHLV
ncbi:type I protein arginine N-methyltransferase Rmt1 [Sporothrix eucalyptigena]|uniref:Type I protein arginine N-methyltransferase Rmt1 n=1 Tax=Sporothrix eucalyptigena TaxID=1812306 RepID=A0ABP0BUT3_9PEZI